LLILLTIARTVRGTLTFCALATANPNNTCRSGQSQRRTKAMFPVHPSITSTDLDDAWEKSWHKSNVATLFDTQSQVYPGTTMVQCSMYEWGIRFRMVEVDGELPLDARWQRNRNFVFVEFQSQKELRFFVVGPSLQFDTTGSWNDIWILESTSLSSVWIQYRKSDLLIEITTEDIHWNWVTTYIARKKERATLSSGGEASTWPEPFHNLMFPKEALGDASEGSVGGCMT
jgi:hypothetical protein